MKVACERCETILRRGISEGKEIRFNGFSGYLCQKCGDAFLAWLDDQKPERQNQTKRQPVRLSGCLAYEHGKCLMMNGRQVMCGGVVGPACGVDEEKRQAFGIE